MRILKLNVCNFRNLTYLELEPSATFNLVYGPNGSGKTSLLEAISFLALGRSFRGTRYPNLINRDKSVLTVSAGIESDRTGFTDTVGISRSRQRDSHDLKLVINGRQSHRLLDLIDKLCVQAIHPQGTELITGGPELRRHYLDWGVYYHNPEYSSCWQQYRKILEQRNVLLKRAAPTPEIVVWDELLCSLAEIITAFREKYLSSLREILTEKCGRFLPNLKLDFSLHKGWENRMELRSLLHSNLEKDRALGYTFYGCHRAELKIKCNQSPAGETLSRGQLKLLVCAMRLSQGWLLQRQMSRSCVYLIDDLSSELDNHSRDLLLDDLYRYNNQVFITNISEDLSFPKHIDCKHIDIAHAIADFN